MSVSPRSAVIPDTGTAAACSKVRFEGLRASYVSGPARILIMAGESPFEEPVEALYSLGKIRRVGYFEDFPDLHLLKRFPEEHVKILEARIPDGSRIPLNRRAAE